LSTLKTLFSSLVSWVRSKPMSWFARAPRAFRPSY